ncbi:MAG: hypothetical protein JWP11_2439 [Frankiales bacterium]|nr:hypothetical protein [Frankiales bacterium]
MTRKVLLGWELGAGFGHAARLLELARALAAAGLEPVLAVRNLNGAWPLLEGGGFPVLPAPVPPYVGDKTWGARSFSDVLSSHGFADVDVLLPVVLAWQGLIELIAPAVVVADHAPALCLATYGDVPTVLVSNGFCLPPSHLPAFPPLVDAPELMPDDALLAGMREVQSRVGREPLVSVPGLFAAAEHFVTVLPELDPYRQHRLQPAVGPLLGPLTPVDVPSEPSFFAYLAASEPGVVDMLTVLSAELPGQVYLRDLSQAARTQLIESGVTVLDRPPPLAAALARASVVLHHGSLGTAEAALGVGRPQVSLPQHLEHGLTSHLLQRMGVGREPEREPAALRKAVMDSLADDVLQRAATVARQVAARHPVGSLAAVVRRCVELAER